MSLSIRSGLHEEPSRIQQLKSWLKKQATSTPFQAIISTTEGLSLGTSALNFFDKITSFTNISGEALAAASWAKYSASGMVTIIMAYMTFKYVHTNIKNMHQHGQQVSDLQDTTEELTTHITELEKIMLLNHEFSKQLLKVLKAQAEDPKLVAAFANLEKELTAGFVAIQNKPKKPVKKAAESKEEDVVDQDDFVVVSAPAQPPVSTSHTRSLLSFSPPPSPVSRSHAHRFFTATSPNHGAIELQNLNVQVDSSAEHVSHRAVAQ